LRELKRLNRKLIYGICIAVIGLLILGGCSQSANKSISERVDLYYKKFEPLNNGELKILAQKPMDDKMLVLAKKYSGDGHAYTKLLLINKEQVIEKNAQGVMPLSMCFIANKLDYENKTIVFGNFNNTKLDIKSNTKKPVEIQYIVVKFKNGEVIKEDVDKAYIIYSSTQSDLESIELYNADGQLQSDLNEIGNVENAEFVDVNLRT